MRGRKIFIATSHISAEWTIFFEKRAPIILSSLKKMFEYLVKKSPLPPFYFFDYITDFAPTPKPNILCNYINKKPGILSLIHAVSFLG